MMLKIVFGVFLVGGLASQAMAEKWDGGCSRQATATTATTEDLGSHNIPDRNSLSCFTFIETDSVGELSPLFSITAEAAVVCFDTDLADSAAGLAAASIRTCPHGVKPSANPEQQCQPEIILAEEPCLEINPGTYYLEINAVPGAASGDTARVTIRGIGSGD